MIGSETFRDVLLPNTHTFLHYENSGRLKKRGEIAGALAENGLEGSRLLATKERPRIYQENLQEKLFFELKMFVMLNYIMDGIEYGCLSASSSELEYTVY